MAFDVKEHLMNLNKDSNGNGRKPERWYLPVAWRLVWFRTEKPQGRILTNAIEINTQEGIAIFQATVMDENGNILAMGTKCETRKGFGDFIEKAETGAIGRALAGAGYGTQFEPELDEGDRLADSPQGQPVHPSCVKCGGDILVPLKNGQPIGTLEEFIKRTEGKCYECWKEAKKNGKPEPNYDGDATTEAMPPKNGNGNKGKPAADKTMARLCILCDEVFGKDEGGIAVMRQWFGSEFGVESRTELSEGQKADAIMRLDEMAKAKA
jgi:hypothetical protein